MFLNPAFSFAVAGGAEVLTLELSRLTAEGFFFDFCMIQPIRGESIQSAVTGRVRLLEDAIKEYHGNLRFQWLIGPSGYGLPELERIDAIDENLDGWPGVQVFRGDNGPDGLRWSLSISTMRLKSSHFWRKARKTATGKKRFERIAHAIASLGNSSEWRVYSELDKGSAEIRASFWASSLAELRPNLDRLLGILSDAIGEGGEIWEKGDFCDPQTVELAKWIGTEKGWLHLHKITLSYLDAYAHRAVLLESRLLRLCDFRIPLGGEDCGKDSWFYLLNNRDGLLRMEAHVEKPGQEPTHLAYLTDRFGIEFIAQK